MNHEETIKRIQSLVPSVMELEFGCEFLRHGSVYRYINACGLHKYRALSEDNMFDESLNIFIKEILGKPITLAVVLLAVKTLECKKCNGQGGHLVNGGYAECEDCGGDMFTLPEDLAGTGFNLYIIVEMWNLSKDNFNDQSDETKEFIGGLLN